MSISIFMKRFLISVITFSYLLLFAVFVFADDRPERERAGLNTCYINGKLRYQNYHCNEEYKETLNAIFGKKIEACDLECKKIQKKAEES